MKTKSLDWKVEQSQKIIKAAMKKWPGKIGMAFTGRKDSSVCMDIIRKTVKKPPSCFFIDHGLHFKESYQTLKKLTRLWKLEVFWETDERLQNKLETIKNLEKKKEIVRELKIKTITQTVKKYQWQALIVPIRWDEQPARAGETYFSKRETHVRVHPILHFTEKDVWDYIKREKIPYNPLYDQGYRSIGEKIFTQKAGEGERSGREKEKEEIMARLRAIGYF
jgi:phosphoadenosine phosphosulfate reductase